MLKIFIMRYLLILASAVFFVSCNTTPGSGTVSKDTGPVRTVFFDKTGMDTTVHPGDNFYAYANGNWVKTAVIPGDQSGWGGFYTLYEENTVKLHGILEEAAKANAPKGSLEQRAGDYYAAGMDTVSIEAKGAAPLKAMLSKIDGIKDYHELMTLVAQNNAAGWSDIMGFFVGADEKNSSQNIAVFSQAGLTLPEKGYYTKTDSATLAAKKAMLVYAANLFVLTGSDTAAATKAAGDILALETVIAQSHRTPTETRDPQKNYNKMSVAMLNQQQPNINWAGYFAAMNVSTDSINVQQPGYYVALDKLLATQPIASWKSKLKFDYIAANAASLSKSFVDARFNFVKILSGQKTQSDRWKKMVQNTDNGLGEILGQLYVKKYFTEKAKSRMDELVKNLQKAFEARIKKSEWMSDSTKLRAATKLNAFLQKIGYPSKWKSYDDVVIDRNDYFGSLQSIRKHNKTEEIGKIGKPVDRTEWGMSTPTVNAYYNPTNNEIVFPAGILQFPFFDENADDAINYGAIGMVIGHEMTHGFDDQGSQYDEVGNMKNWWNKDDLAKFKAKTGNVVTQYNGFKLFGNMAVNGELTLGENLADIGGIAIAYDAFKLTKQGQGNELIDGLTPDQRFFLGFAQEWRSKLREESARLYLNIDPHSPDMFRVNAPLANFDPFYAAFNVKEGDAMYIKPEMRARIW